MKFALLWQPLKNEDARTATLFGLLQGCSGSPERDALVGTRLARRRPIPSRGSGLVFHAPRDRYRVNSTALRACGCNRVGRRGRRLTLVWPGRQRATPFVANQAPGSSVFDAQSDRL
jgi:hypothetical protein